MTIKEALEYKGHLYIGEEEVNIAKHEKGKYILSIKMKEMPIILMGVKNLEIFI